MSSTLNQPSSINTIPINTTSISGINVPSTALNISNSKALNISNSNVGTYSTGINFSEPKFTINQDSYGTWQVTVNTKNKKFVRSLLLALLNDCAELELEESIEVTKQINAIQ